MALTVYASEADMKKIWSAYGVLQRLDDDQDGSADTGMSDAVLEQATGDVNFACFPRGYSVAQLAASTWVKWITAFLGCEKLAIRRGNGIPVPMVEESNRIRSYLDEIKNGMAYLIGDTGLIGPNKDSLPSVSNMTVDSRTGRAKLRRVERTSTGKRAPGSVKQDTLNDGAVSWWW